MKPRLTRTKNPGLSAIDIPYIIGQAADVAKNGVNFDTTLYLDPEFKKTLFQLTIISSLSLITYGIITSK